MQDECKVRNCKCVKARVGSFSGSNVGSTTLSIYPALHTGLRVTWAHERLSRAHAVTRRSILTLYHTHLNILAQHGDALPKHNFIGLYVSIIMQLCFNNLLHSPPMRVGVGYKLRSFSSVCCLNL